MILAHGAIAIAGLSSSTIEIKSIFLNYVFFLTCILNFFFLKLRKKKNKVINIKVIKIIESIKIKQFD